MIWAIVASILDGFSTILEKRAVELNKSGPTNLYMISESGTFLLGIFWLLFGFIAFNFTKDFFYWFLFTLGSTLSFPIGTIIKQYCYKNEKISVLQPFEPIKEIFSILVWFFLFVNTSSWVTFIIAIITFFVIWLFSFDFRKFRFSRISSLYILSQIIYGIDIIFLAYAMSFIWEVEFLTIFWFIVFPAMFFYNVFSKNLSKLRKNKKIFFFFSVSDAFIGTGTALISLYLIKNIWIVMTSLLGLITLATTLISGYFFLGDKPHKKDLFLALFSLTMISIWYIFY